MKIVFVSTMDGTPWGGSEPLWSEAAMQLARGGQAVAANVCGWPQRPAPVMALAQAGVTIQERPLAPDHLRPGSVPRILRNLLEPLLSRFARRAFAGWLRQQHADLICISNGGIDDQGGLMKLCAESGSPYVVIAQANAEQWWPDEARAQGLIKVYANARRIFFVSERNRRLLEAQLGIDLPNAEVVRNPVMVSRTAVPAWPTEPEWVRLACVGRLDPDAKGQDLLLQLLATEPWRSRKLSVSFYGKGGKEAGLRRLATRLGLGERARFCGHTGDVEQIWATHQALVLPSRFEGLPVAMVEAMLCGRPVIVTDVAGNAEIVQDGVTGFVAEAPTVRHLNAALERAWDRRDQWKAIGEAAARSIREAVPADPAAVFAQRLLEVAATNLEPVVEPLTVNRCKN